MKYKTVSSKQARNNFSDLLSMVVNDQSVIITRYGKPKAVLIDYDNFKIEPKKDNDFDRVMELRDKSEKLNQDKIDKLVEKAIKSY